MWLHIAIVISVLTLIVIGSYLLYLSFQYTNSKEKYKSYLRRTIDYGSYNPLLNLIFNNVRPMVIHPNDEFISEKEIDGHRMIKLSSKPDFLSDLGITDAFVINLDRASNKMDIMKNNLNNAGITNFTRMKAFDGKFETTQMRQELPEFKINDENDLKIHQNFINLLNYDYVGIGQQGCTCSHLYTWKYIVQNKIPAALVLEDDICFHSMFRQLLTDAWEIKDKNGVLFSFALTDLETKKCGKYKTPTWVKYSGRCTACYIVTYDGAKQLLQRFSKKYFPILPCADDLPFLSLYGSYKLYYNNQKYFKGYPQHCGNRGCGIVTTPSAESSTSSISNVNKLL